MALCLASSAVDFHTRVSLHGLRWQIETQRRLPVALQPSPSAVLIGFAFYPLVPIIVISFVPKNCRASSRGE
jgi:hypothetical protein